jgi:hypothetical protein
MNSEFNLYVGCALTHASEEFKVKVKILKNKLEENGVCNVLKFIGLVDGTDKEVYEHDINNCVRGCDLLVAICDQASIGLGYELATQVEDRQMPALAVAHADSKVTRLVSGIINPSFEFKRYQDFDNLYEIILKKIKEVKASLS